MGTRHRLLLRFRVVVAVVPMLVLPSGCSLGIGPLPGGDLHQGIAYVDPEWGTASFPDRIAVGTTFGVVVPLDESSSSVESLNTRKIAPSAAPPTLSEVASTCCTQWFRAVAPGLTALEGGTKDGLVDFVNLTTADPTSLATRVCAKEYNAIKDATDALGPYDCVSPDGVAADLTIVRGNSLAPTVCVRPVAAEGMALEGLLPLDWSTSGSATLELHVAHDHRCATIGALTLGTATVTVTSGTLHAEIPIEVAP